MCKLILKATEVVTVLYFFCSFVSYAATVDQSNDFLNTADTAIEVEKIRSNALLSENSSQPDDVAMLKIKILSGNGDIHSAKKMATLLESMGYKISSVDYAPRSDFKSHTIYFADNFKTQAQNLANAAALDGAVLKPLSWKSEFDLIVVAIAAPILKEKTAPKLKVKILSGDGNLMSAKKMKKQIEGAGYKTGPVDYASRSDFKNITIYFSKNFNPEAKKLANSIHQKKTVIKPMSWASKYDLIVVTGSLSKKEKVKETDITIKDEVHKLNKNVAVLLSEAHALYLDQNFGAAKDKYKTAENQTNKLIKQCNRLTGEAAKPETEADKIRSSEEAMKRIKVKVLSKGLDLNSAKKAARQIEKMGFDIISIDYALRSDLKANTLYYGDSLKPVAEDIAFNLEEGPYLKPLKWDSVYDIILVTGDPIDYAAWYLEKWMAAEKQLKKKLDHLLPEAQSLYMKNRFKEAEEKYKEVSLLLKKAANLCDASLALSKKKAALEETSGMPLRKTDRLISTKLNIEDAIKIAYLNNAVIKEADEKINSAIEGKKSARADFLPKATAQYSYTRLKDQPTTAFENPFAPVVPGDFIEFSVGNQDIYKWNVTLSQPLFTGFALTSQYQLKELGILSSQIEKDLTVIDLVRDVKKTYFSLLLVKKALKVADDAVNNLKSHEKNAQQYYKQGMIPYNDLLKSQVALANVLQEREKAAAGVKMATAALNTLLNYDVNATIEIEDVLSIQPVSYQYTDLVHEAVENRPELYLLNLGIKSLDQGIRLVKSAYYPTIGIAGFYEQTGDNLLANENDFGSTHTAAMMLQAEWMLFKGGKTRSDVAKYKYDKKALLKKYETAENGIKLQVKNAFSNLKVSDNNIITSQKSLAQAKENWRITNLQYQEQVATSTDVLDARTFLSQAEMNYYSALYGYMMALADLERAAGKKHPMLHKDDDQEKR